MTSCSNGVTATVQVEAVIAGYVANDQVHAHEFSGYVCFSLAAVSVLSSLVDFSFFADGATFSASTSEKAFEVSSAGTVSCGIQLQTGSTGALLQTCCTSFI